MGGIGSGRTASHCAREKAEDSQPFDIRRLHRNGLLRPGASAGWQWSQNGRAWASVELRAGVAHLELSYLDSTRGAEAKLICQTVEIETTPCRLGGHRPWFVCPGCARRVALVYRAGSRFSCRRCKGLAYSSQSEGAADRALRHANRLRRKLGWVPGIAHGHGGKPKGMHWRCYFQFVNEHDTWVKTYLAELEPTLTSLRRHVAAIENSHPWSA